ncbi:MAG TPA: prolyl oligopeptidase, partial [Bacteroidetes bacterium]|nr:prolyl oligopeptidase [Bacteroidota bacterium]
MKRIASLAFLLAVAISFALAQTAYKLPPKEVVDILDAPPTPVVLVSPRSDALLLVEYQSQPSIALLAKPILRLGGLRIDPELRSRQRTVQYTGIVVRRVDVEKTVRVLLPEGSRIGMPSWSNDGSKIAFTRDVEGGVELWVAEAATGKAKAVGSFRVNDVLGSPFQWLSD